jgi:hypothetical protein
MANCVNRDAYCPSVPSPLNPARLGIPAKPFRPQNAGKPARKHSSVVSPTQRLLRQKAAEAWRCESLLRAIGRTRVPCKETSDVNLGSHEIDAANELPTNDLLDMEEAQFGLETPPARWTNRIRYTTTCFSAMSTHPVIVGMALICACGMLSILRLSTSC